jgi:tyrosyl-tRNA synthetase
MPSLATDLEFRGLIHQVTDPAVVGRLDRQRLTAYIGFDPTADSLHIGSLLQLCTLRRLQLAGHRPIAVAGGATAAIGDPGGKSEERPLLTEEQIRANLDGIRPQLERFLDFGDGSLPTASSPDAPVTDGSDGAGALLLDNAAWLGTLHLVDFLRDVGKGVTVNQMVAKESVRSRFDRPEQGISYTEFSYMLLQAVDFLHLFDHYGCRLQVGGSDQWGNITMGVDLIRRARSGEAWGLTTPLVVKADGSKFGKTEKGTIWLDAGRTSPYQLFQFFFRTDDGDVGQLLRFLTFLSHDEITRLDAATTEHPERRDGQRALAREVCTLAHGATEASRAERAAGALYSEEIASLDERTLLDVCSEAPTSDIARIELSGPDRGLSLVDALVLSGLVPSKRQARTTIVQGGAYVNNRRVDDPDSVLVATDLLFDRYLVLRRGKRDYHLVRFV